MTAQATAVLDSQFATAALALARARRALDLIARYLLAEKTRR